MSFPRDFTWGAATSSYQIEGAAREDGKGLSVCDTICQRPGAVKFGHTGDVACDHYHRFRKDVALMKEIGLAAYRLSLCWPRILPGGTGAVNQKGLDFYSQLIDALLEADIEPFVTLFHWDYPTELYYRGGWLSPDSPDWFAEYTRVVVDALSDRVKNWITLNEPQVFIGMGHMTGEIGPGLNLDFPEILRAVHHVLLAHGKSVQVIRACAKGPAVVSMASAPRISIPETETPGDIEAARKAVFDIKPDTTTIFHNSWWHDPIYLGRYPEDGLKYFAPYLPKMKDSELETIHQPLDLFAFNNYNGELVRAGEEKALAPEPGTPFTHIGWHVTPRSLYWGSRFFHERYGLPIIITENGMANADWVSLDGKVHDPQRIDFLKLYLREYERAGRDGIPIKGYFLWSLMDNFEWAQGYTQRFGIVHLDYRTQKRTLKDSAYWYREVIRTNGETLLKQPGE